jgi:hypothetical protein
MTSVAYRPGSLGSPGLENPKSKFTIPSPEEVHAWKDNKQRFTWKAHACVIAELEARKKEASSKSEHAETPFKAPEAAQPAIASKSEADVDPQPLNADVVDETQPFDASVPTNEPMRAEAPPTASGAPTPATITKCNTFGIDAQRLNADLVDGTTRFLGHYGHAKQDENAVKHRKHYKAVEVSYQRDDGSTDKEVRYVRTGMTRAQRFQRRSKKDGERFKRACNHLSDLFRKKTGRPRMTGSNYGSLKGSGPLIAPATLMPAEQMGLVASSGKLGAGATRSGVMTERPDLLPSVSGVSEAFFFMGLPGAVVDGMEAVDLQVGVEGRRAQDKATVLRCREDALRFRRHLGSATTQDAQAYLDFTEAAGRLYAPTEEERATDNVIRDTAIRNVGIQPVSTAFATAVQITGHVAQGLAAPLGVAAGPLGVIGGIGDVVQAKDEIERRVAQAETADQRLQVMERMSAQRSGASVFNGALSSLKRQQERLMRQADREIIFSKFRAARGVAGGIVGGVAATAATGAVLAGATAAVAFPPLAPLWAVPALVGGTALAVRSGYRHAAEHSSKEREDAARAAITRLSREELEALLSTPAGQPATVTVSLGKGEYLAAEDRFAGERTITFDVRENEYVGLHMFALHIQDLVRNGDADAAQPWIETLKGLGVDAVRLLAICKVASSKPASQRLDFIRSQIAPALGMKHRARALHPSVVLGPFQNALLDAGIGKKAPPSPNRYRRVRAELIKQFGDGEEGMALFKTVASEFLRKTGKLEPSPLRDHLGAFLAVEALESRDESDAVPEITADEVVKLFNTPATDFDDRNVQRKLARMGFSSEEEVSMALHIGAADLWKLPADESARIRQQMAGFTLRLERP